MENVLVLGNDTRSFLTSVRSLGKYGLKVYVAECSRSDVLLSKYVYKSIKLGDFDNSKDDWCHKLFLFLEQVSIKFILPVDDQSYLKLKYYELIYGKLQGLYIPCDSAKKITDNKKLSTNLASQLKIPIAKTLYIDSISELQKYIRNNKKSFVVKPLSSFNEDNILSKDKVLIVSNINECYAYQSIIETYLIHFGCVQIQEYFDGIGTGIELLAYEGEILTVFQHLRIHEPQKGGGSSLRKSIAIDKRMLNNAKQIVKAINYSGVMMVEFKWNLNTNEYVFIEINGRLWGSLPLAVNCGIDFPLDLYRMYIENIRTFNVDYSIGFYCRNLEADFWWKVSLIKEKAYLRLIMEIIQQLLRRIKGREYIDEFDFDDKLVISETKRQILNKLKNNYYIKRLKKSLRNVSPPRSIVRKLDNVLFVCYGNICRSAFADCYRRYITHDNDHTKSAGYHNIQGRHVDLDFASILESFHVPADAFSSAIINEDLLDWADYIFCFDERNYYYLWNNYKTSINKVYLLGAYDSLDRGVPFIDDPYSKDLNEKKKCADRIKYIIDTYFER